MIRIQLVHEGRVVKTISSRVHEAIVLEQVKRFADPVDEIRVVEGELSEAGKGILHHVAKKIVPAAMAAGMAMAAHGQNVGTPGQNRDFPGLDRSIGQHIGDIFSPNYQERMRQRNYEMQTQQAEWTARQNELRQARIQQAREAGRAEAGASNVKVYDQARTSNDGKHFVIYGMDNTITRIPTQGTEFMPADSQRLAHYIAPNGQVYYVRHAAGTMTESVVREFAPNDGGNGGDDYLRTLASAWYNQDLSAIAHEVKKDKNPKKKGMMDRVIDAQRAVEKMLARGVVCGDGKVRKFSIDYNGDFDGVIMTYEDYAEYSDYGDDGEDIDSRTGKPWPNSKYDQIEFTDDQLDEGFAPIGTIPASGTGNNKPTGTGGPSVDDEQEAPGLGGNTPNTPNATTTIGGGNQQLAKPGQQQTGKTTNLTIDQNGQISLGDEEEPAGIHEASGNELINIIMKHMGDVKQYTANPGGGVPDSLESELHAYYFDQLSPQAQRDADDEGEIAALFDKDLADIFHQADAQTRPAVNESTDHKLKGILDKYAESYAEFKAGGDIDDNPDFFEALYDYYLSNGEMPYGVAKGREGDPYTWIADQLDDEAGNLPIDEGAEFGAYYSEQLAQKVFDQNPNLDTSGRADAYFDVAWPIMVADLGKKRAQYEINSEDFPMDTVSAYSHLQKQGVTESEEDSPVAQAVTRRILMQRADLLSKFGPAKVLAAIEDVADFVGDVDEIGSSDVSAWVKHVEQTLGNVAEDVAEGDEDGSADDNIIMQLRKASDYEKPTTLVLGDNTRITINKGTADKMLAKFNMLKPESKALMQDTLNTREGFHEMLNYFNEREIHENAKSRAKSLITSVFGKIK